VTGVRTCGTFLGEIGNGVFALGSNIGLWAIVAGIFGLAGSTTVAVAVTAFFGNSGGGFTGSTISTALGSTARMNGTGSVTFGSFAGWRTSTGVWTTYFGLFFGDSGTTLASGCLIW
jgi:hypothetical protein